MKLVMLFTAHSYSKVRVGKHVSDTIPIKNVLKK